MQRYMLRSVTAAAIGALVSAAPVHAQPVQSPAERARADGGRPPYTAADVRFISGMIGHHAQAVLMAGWAPTHGASRAVRVLCERIVVAQRDEIAFMQRWLGERGKPVPEADASHDLMPGMEGMHEMMPGMLTADELRRLDAARGAEFDRLFLTFMIRHHQGAITMVEQLFANPGAGQDDNVFKFASDVQADQSTEIDRMTSMLEAMK
jgi:uncharacterized protein (DUF305 family)